MRDPCPVQAQTPQDLSVEQAVQVAMENSLRRRLALADVNMAQDKVAQTISAFGPNLTLQSGIYRYNKEPSLVQLERGLTELNNALSAMTSGQVPAREEPDDSLTYYGYDLQVTQPVYTGRKLTATRNMAQANRENSRRALAAADNDLVLAVKKAYYTVLLCRQMALTMDEAVASMENHVREATEYHRMDTVPKLDVLRAKEKLADLKQTQLYAHNNLRLSGTSLNYVLGVDLSTAYFPSEQMALQPMPGDLGHCQDQALSRRPEIQAMDAKIEMAREGISLANSGRLPFVALVAGYHHYEPENEDPSARVGLVAGIKLYDHGMVNHQIAEARDALQKAETGKKELQRGIRLEVEQAFCNAEVARQAIEVAQSSLNTAEETLRTARTRYRVGLSTSLERLDAEVALTQARTNHIQALSRYNIAMAELERAMGKGPDQTVTAGTVH